MSMPNGHASQTARKAAGETTDSLLIPTASVYPPPTGGDTGEPQISLQQLRLLWLSQSKERVLSQINHQAGALHGD